ncbi:unnamed protein product [Symbiodinium necroappetens]|uniref:Reverse transcriptase domain-containing protein n=1 Tax=Symbiodinium necroappetens TaxID=1628268 RepID=A0A812XHV0_9DINO|nr:unnamed protein product [Symbiodinium necroappetens]
MTVSSRELKALLGEHLREMKEAWGDIKDRVHNVETQVKGQKKELKAIHVKNKTVDQAIMGIQAKGDATARKTEELEGEIERIKTQIVGLQTEGQNQGKGESEGKADPWAEYLRKGEQGQPKPVPSRVDKLTTLSEEDQRSLIVGGWLADTRRLTIESEARDILEQPAFAPLVDTTKLTIFGPRRSFGILRFNCRDNETAQEVKKRMWEVVNKIREMKISLPSTVGEQSEGKRVWASFLKTPEARKRSAMCSLTRRVVMQLARESRTETGEAINPNALEVTNYDVDWATGTIWHGDLKVASATHRKNHSRSDDYVQVNQGWVDIRAVTAITGAAWKEAAVASWNLGGQDVEKLATSACKVDIFLTQEVARGEPGWREVETDTHIWVLHQARDQWRTVGVGIAIEIFDSVVAKKQTDRGIFVLVKLKGRGKVVLGTIHCHTGATNRVYQQSADDFLGQCAGTWRKYPCILGADLNEAVKWDAGEQRGEILAGSANLNYFVSKAVADGLRPIAPLVSHRDVPTHYPRDPRRQGRHIDVIWGRLASTGPVHVDAEARHRIGTDHALLTTQFFLQQRPAKWVCDSRPRFVTGPLPAEPLLDADDVAALAAKYTRPRNGVSYKDTPEVKQCIAAARRSGRPEDWKRVHKVRKQAKRQWEQDRLARILQGDWSAYRCRKMQTSRKRGWWAKMVELQGEEEITEKAKLHLASKLCGPDPQAWDDELERVLEDIVISEPWTPFVIEDLHAELGRMKLRAAVGPDLIGVDLLRHLAAHDTLGHDLLDIINHVVEHGAVPTAWDKSLLALLAKVDVPSGPADLRPIAMSSALQKLVSKMVMARTFPHIRQASDISCCGKNRQAADLVGSLSRIRDVAKEWRMPLLVAKLDIRGAFDALSRRKLADFLCLRLAGCGVSRETKYLVRQLKSNYLVGKVPGGGEVTTHCSTGIKQGAPESAELFGLILESALSELLSGKKWGDLGHSVPDLPMDLLMYQDDIFLWDKTAETLQTRLRLVNARLSDLGLQLATSKTCVVSTPEYRGSRTIKVSGETIPIQSASTPLKVLGLNFLFDGDQGRQAKELIARVRAAFGAHRELLRGRSSWENKVFAVRTLLESTFTWVAGAVYWHHDDLGAMNTLQIHILRDAFRLNRKTGKLWHEWNQRTMRFVRAWLHQTGLDRWSTRTRKLQHGLAGHWARQVEDDGRGIEPTPGVTARFLIWRNLEWWRR